MSLDALSVAIGAIPSTVAAYAAVIAAKRGGEIRERTQQIEKQTNGEMERKIRAAVLEVFKDHRGEVTEAVMAESVRHLLNAMIGAEAQPYPEERKRLL